MNTNKKSIDKVAEQTMTISFMVIVACIAAGAVLAVVEGIIEVTGRMETQKESTID